MSDDLLVKSVLGHLILKPSHLEGVDLTSTDFPPGRLRGTFEEISHIWEDSRPAEIDPVFLAEKIGGNGAFDWTSRLTDYVTKNQLNLESLNSRARDIRRRALTAQLRKALHAQDAFQDLDLTEIRPLIDQLENLSNKDSGVPSVITLSDVKPCVVPWLWPNYIPSGRATLISGDPGCGKSWFGLDLAARLSRGRPWPDGSPGEKPGKTLYMTVEDDLNDTLRPRIDALGGDPAMIAAYNPESLHLDLATPRGLKRLDDEIQRLGDVRLVVIDPVIDFSGTVNPNSGEEVRALLTPLINLSNRLNFALVLIGHLNKSQSLSAIYRAGGSTGGWLGKVRAAFLIFRNIDDKTLRHVIPLKNNLARHDPNQLEFRIENDKLNISVSREDIDPDEQLNPQPGRKPRERDDALEWLTEFFGDRDEIPQSEIKEAAEQAGIAYRTLRRAKEKSGDFGSRRSFDKDGTPLWMWTKHE